MQTDERTMARLRKVAEAARDRFRAEHYKCACGCSAPYFEVAITAWVEYARAGGLCPIQAEKLATEAMIAHAAEVEKQAEAMSERPGQTLH